MCGCIALIYFKRGLNSSSSVFIWYSSFILYELAGFIPFLLLLFALYLTTLFNLGDSLTLSLPQSSIDDLVFSVFTSNFFKLSYKISLLKNRFVTLFFIRFS